MHHAGSPPGPSHHLKWMGSQLHISYRSVVCGKWKLREAALSKGIPWCLDMREWRRCHSGSVHLHHLGTMLKTLHSERPSKVITSPCPISSAPSLPHVKNDPLQQTVHNLPLKVLFQGIQPKTPLKYFLFVCFQSMKLFHIHY